MGKKIINCQNCKIDVEVWSHHDSKYCGYDCAVTHKYKIFIESWTTGKTNPTLNTSRKGASKRIYRYFKENIHHCQNCGIDKTWNNKYLTLELDHIDGDRGNNYYDNLRYLCPNCHSQTDTYRNKTRLP